MAYRTEREGWLTKCGAAGVVRRGRGREVWQGSRNLLVLVDSLLHQAEPIVPLVEGFTTATNTTDKQPSFSSRLLYRIYIYIYTTSLHLTSPHTHTTTHTPKQCPTAPSASSSISPTTTKAKIPPPHTPPPVNPPTPSTPPPPLPSPPPPSPPS